MIEKRFLFYLQTGKKVRMGKKGDMVKIEVAKRTTKLLTMREWTTIFPRAGKQELCSHLSLPACLHMA